MTLQDLLRAVSWLDLESEMLAIYPEEAEFLSYYKRLYWRLLNLQAAENPAGHSIQMELCDEDEFLEEMDGLADDVFFEGQVEEEPSDEQWSRYLGFYVPADLLKKIRYAEILVHVLMEATYGSIEPLESDFER